MSILLLMFQSPQCYLHDKSAHCFLYEDDLKEMCGVKPKQEASLVILKQSEEEDEKDKKDFYTIGTADINEICDR